MKCWMRFETRSGPSNDELPTVANPIAIAYTLLDRESDKWVDEALNDLVHIEMAVLQHQNLSALIK